MKKVIFFIFTLYINGLVAQSNYSKFWDLSGPKRTWVLFHLFKAKKSSEVSKETNKVADSISKTNLLDGDPSGGQVDAFRHAYWMARLKQEIGHSAAESLGIAHEKENYLTYKKKALEEGVVPDKISSEMDLYNNNEGLKLISKNSKISKKSLIHKIANAIQLGKMKIIKKDRKGNFLTCDGKLISENSLKGKWINNKCLVASNIKD
ncbi:MAG: hypothetical protein P8P88_00185 [Polaribacter sp.]|nr:hypothetical protein [Polaribacter sp.]